MAIPTCTHGLERLPGYPETGQCLDWATKFIIRKYGEILFLLLEYLFNIDRDKFHRVIPALLSEFLLRAFCLIDGKDCRQPTRGVPVFTTFTERN